MRARRIRRSQRIRTSGTATPLRPMGRSPEIACPISGNFSFWAKNSPDFPQTGLSRPSSIALEQAIAQENAQPDRALLHSFAAAALARSESAAWSEADARALAHVEIARTMLIGLGEQDYSTKFWLVALLRARLRLARGPGSDGDVVAALEACEEALAMAPVEAPNMVAPVAYNAGLLAAGVGRPGATGSVRARRDAVPRRLRTLPGGRLARTYGRRRRETRRFAMNVWRPPRRAQPIKMRCSRTPGASPSLR
jgi:hypothetical protein